MADRCDLSVVVPVRDGAATLLTLLAALEAQTLPAERFEVVIVDDGSTDSTPELLAAWRDRDPERRTVTRSGGVGPAAARNAGARLVRADWIVFTDADVEPTPPWLEALASAARNGVGALEGAIDPWPPEPVDGGVGVVVNQDGGRYMTANMAYRRQTFEDLGGFDERFRDAFLEDSDLAFRALDAGHVIPFVADARVRHGVALPPTLAVAVAAARKVRWFPLLERKHPQRYRTELRPILRPLTRVDAHVLVGLGGAVALLCGRGAVRVAGTAAAVNAARVLHGTGALRDPSRAAVGVTLAVAKAAWLLEGTLRFRGVRR